MLPILVYCEATRNLSRLLHERPLLVSKPIRLSKVRADSLTKTPVYLLLIASRKVK
jgi:hypothetical protein